jgi:hypothetical protein
LKEIEFTARKYRDRIEHESPTPMWVRERMNLLGTIYDSPNHRLSRSEFYRVGEENGYRRQGLGGLFRRPAKLEYDRNDEYVELTSFGKRELFDLRQQYT